MTTDRTSTTSQMAELTDNLRQLADTLDMTHGDLPFLPMVTTSRVVVDADWFVQHHADTLPEQKAMAASIVRILGGTWAKVGEFGTTGNFAFKRSDGDVRFQVITVRDAVCERVVTGTREVTVPATSAIPAEPERVEVVEDFTWECGSLLAATDAVSAVAS